MKKIILAFAACLALLTGAQADTSYLLIQGPFGLSGTTQTFKWQVDYAPGTLSTGQDLLDAVFGKPTLTGTDGSNHPLWTAGNNVQGITFTEFSFGLSLSTITLNSLSATASDSLSLGWNYYVDGGGGQDWFTQAPVSYSVLGSWQASNDGMSTRTLSNGSFDAWVFGTADWNSYTFAEVTGSNNAPTTQNFSAISVASVPEPGSIALLGIGLGGLLLGRHRTKK